jgi:hypothetical protein
MEKAKQNNAANKQALFTLFPPLIFLPLKTAVLQLVVEINQNIQHCPKKHITLKGETIKNHPQLK